MMIAAAAAAAAAAAESARFNLVNVDIRQAAAALSDFTRQPVRLAPEVVGRVSLIAAEPVDAAEATRLLASVAQEAGWQLQVDARKGLLIHGGGPASADQRLVEQVHSLGLLRASDIASRIRALLSPQGSIGAPDEHRLLVVDSARVQAQVERVILEAMVALLPMPEPLKSAEKSSKAEKVESPSTMTRWPEVVESPSPERSTTVAPTHDVRAKRTEDEKLRQSYPSSPQAEFVRAEQSFLIGQDGAQFGLLYQQAPGTTASVMREVVEDAAPKGWRLMVQSRVRLEGRAVFIQDDRITEFEFTPNDGGVLISMAIVPARKLRSVSSGAPSR